MDWIQFLQIICVPAFGCFFYKLGEQRREIKNVEKDLNEFKLAVAKEYATQNHITRLETKIDELRELIWEIHNGTKTNIITPIIIVLIISSIEEDLIELVWIFFIIFVSFPVYRITPYT